MRWKPPKVAKGHLRIQSSLESWKTKEGSILFHPGNKYIQGFMTLSMYLCIYPSIHPCLCLYLPSLSFLLSVHPSILELIFKSEMVIIGMIL